MIKRHLLKTISYRILSSSIGFIVLFFATGSVKAGATFTVAELVYKPLLYFIHERLYFKYVKYGIKDKQWVEKPS